MSDRLSDDEIAAEIAALPGWVREDDELVRSYNKQNFDGSIAFVNAIAAAANAADHHPDLAISWGDVMVRLTSHDVGGISRRDIALAHTIDALD
jgi:4a-hydroxytetrahydrobiopterin dehydratase